MSQVNWLTFLDRIEPFTATAATPAPLPCGFSGRGPQSGYPDPSPNQPLNSSSGQTLVSSPQPQYSQSGPSHATGPIHVSGISAQPRTGKAGLRAQQHHVVQPPVQLDDSGARFNENGEQVSSSLRLPNEVPPSYTPR